MSIPTNPFCKTYDAVFEILFGGENNALADMVRVGNRINFGTESERDRSPTKPTVTTADLPEVRLIDVGGTLNLHANSSSLSYIQQLSLYTQTGDWRYANFISLLNWYTIVNMSKWRTLLTSLRWNEKPFVKNILNTPIQIGAQNPERSNAVAGWTSIWQMQLELRIDNVDIVYKES